MTTQPVPAQSRAMLPLRAYVAYVTRHTIWCNCLECEPTTLHGRRRTDDPEPDIETIRVIRYGRDIPVNVDITDNP